LARRRRDRPDGVGSERERDEPRPLGELPLERLQVERHVVVPDVDPANRRAGIARREDPGPNVGIVIESGHDDLVPGLEGSRERA